MVEAVSVEEDESDHGFEELFVDHGGNVSDVLGEDVVAVQHYPPFFAHLDHFCCLITEFLVELGIPFIF